MTCCPVTWPAARSYELLRIKYTVMYVVSLLVGSETCLPSWNLGVASSTSSSSSSSGLPHHGKHPRSGAESNRMVREFVSYRETVVKGVRELCTSSLVGGGDVALLLPHGLLYFFIGCSSFSGVMARGSGAVALSSTGKGWHQSSCHEE